MNEYAKSPWFDPEFDEETATLLYFPTGGGKSEAFFGLLIFNLFFDRLRGKTVGVTALIRYPLRLLTLQQAQRLLSILMRAELVRRAASIGGAPFEIGFWVGKGNTPNQSSDPKLDPVPRMDDPKWPDDRNATAAYEEINESFNKTPICPLCGEQTGLRRLRLGTADEIAIVCFNKVCRWNQETGKSPLPFLIVDQDIYRHAPAVLLGVIDKLALIGQHPSTINRVIGMFGLARWRELGNGRLVMPTRKMLKEGLAANGCEALAPAYEAGAEAFVDPLPSLIIQDEAHLLEESLGTFAGLFETLLEQLFGRVAELLGPRVARSPFGSEPARMPKVIAATATVSVPEQQFGALYQRKHMHFPYPGTSIYRSFYSVPATPNDPARKGLGGNSPRAPEIEAPWMRTYASIMTNGRNHTVTTVAVLAAYHLAITEFWEDLLREDRRDAASQRLGASLTDPSPLRAFHAQAIRRCADSDSSILPSLLDLMRISLTYVTNKKGGDQVIDAFREEVAKVHRRHGRSVEQLHTRLISGGVDVAEIQEIMAEAERGSQASARTTYGARVQGDLSKLGMDELVLLRGLDICEFSFGYTRVSPTPSIPIKDREMPVRLRAFSHAEKHKRPVYVLEQKNEGFYVRLNEERVIQWLALNGLGAGLPSRDGMRLGGLLIEEYADFGRFLEDYRERTAEDRTPRSIGSYVYLLLHTMAHHFAHAVVEYSGLEHGSIGEYVFPADLAFLVYRKGMTPDLGNLSAMWRNHGMTLLEQLLSDRSMKCDSGSLCDQRGGACPACIMAPEVSCLAGNNLLSRAALNGGPPPGWDAVRTPLTGFFQVAGELADAA